MDSVSWRQALHDRMPPDLALEIDTYEGQLELKRQGKLEDRVMAESRLRRGVYGQRYDNGQRHDGIGPQTLEYPDATLTKGPDTLWAAPGMQRIKIPAGGLDGRQMETLAELAEEYADGILHVTTRQDFQLHFVHIDDTPDLMRRLAAVGITTREACGNSVRNVTCCPLAGVCRDETFDVTPHARALARFLLGHPDCQDFGRKFKPAFSGCAQHACGLLAMHDLGFLARVRPGDGQTERGFAVHVGGGLGAVPHQALVLEEFVPEGEILPIAQAVARVFARLGEKRNRNRARIKFLVAKLGIEEFRRLVAQERAALPHDRAWTAYLGELPAWRERPVGPTVPLGVGPPPEGFEAWARTNVYHQRQSGYAAVTVHLPLGDISAGQLRRLADVARQYAGENVRTTVEQNILLRWVNESDLTALYRRLKELGLGEGGAGTVVDVTACPGTDTCKLGIASSRGLAAELRRRLAARCETLPQAVEELKIKISGCFNSCGQHHVADLGFYGNSRKIGNYTVPHFQVVLGGQWSANAASYGLAVGSVPSKAIPDLVDAITARFAVQRQPGESFQSFVSRLGRQEVRAIVEPFMKVPAYAERPEYYSDWGDPREFTIGDMGVGECAGAVVSLFAMEIAKSESVAFEAQVQLDAGDFRRADDLAYRAMLLAARALLLAVHHDIGEEPGAIVEAFRRRFCDTHLFSDKYAGATFAQYLLSRHESRADRPDRESARRLISEAQLFIDATHACEGRLAASAAGGAARP